ncbi:MAG: deoxyribose-phosphate aldolase [Halobacteriota archaeon]
MERDEFAGAIDHTLLSKDARRSDFEAAVDVARELGLNVCLPPSRLDLAADLDGEVMTVVGFPMGYSETEVKVREAEIAVERGADSVDVACDVTRMKSGEFEAFHDDLAAVVEVAPSTKAILEVGLLTDVEVRRAAELAVDAGVDYLKTSTGYFGNVSLDDVALLAGLELDVEVKASGGVRSAERALRLLEAGASRVGSSAGAEIAREFERGLHGASKPG